MRTYVPSEVQDLQVVEDLWLATRFGFLLSTIL